MGHISAEIDHHVIDIVHIQSDPHFCSFRTESAVNLGHFNLAARTIQSSFIIPQTVFEVSWYIFNPVALL